MSIIVIIITVLLIFGLKPTNSTNCGIHQPTILGQLRQTLLCHYDISERPNSDLETPLEINLQLEVKSFDFTERGVWSQKRPQLILSCWMPMSWIDDHLKWDPIEWDHIDKILVSSKEIWMPDVTLHNSDTGKSIVDHTEVHCEVTFHGEVLCVLPVTFEVLCRSDYKKWPYGYQNCWFFFSSWMSTRKYIDYNNDTFDISFDETQENTVWKIIQAKSRVAIKTFKEREYPNLSVNLRLERLPSTYELSFQPAAIFVTLSNLMVFCIDPDRLKKQRFGVIFLSMFIHYFVFTSISWYLPNVGDTIPDILLFFRDSLVVTMIALLETILVRKIIEFYFTIPVTLENLLVNLHASSSGRIIFVEFTPGSGVAEGNLSLEEAIKNSVNNKKPVKVEILLVKLIDRVAFMLIFVMYLIYIGILTYDWM